MCTQTRRAQRLPASLLDGSSSLSTAQPLFKFEFQRCTTAQTQAVGEALLSQSESTNPAYSCSANHGSEGAAKELSLSSNRSSTRKYHIFNNGSSVYSNVADSTASTKTTLVSAQHINLPINVLFFFPFYYTYQFLLQVTKQRCALCLIFVPFLWKINFRNAARSIVCQVVVANGCQVSKKEKRKRTWLLFILVQSQ